MFAQFLVKFLAPATPGCEEDQPALQTTKAFKRLDPFELGRHIEVQLASRSAQQYLNRHCLYVRAAMARMQGAVVDAVCAQLSGRGRVYAIAVRAMLLGTLLTPPIAWADEALDKRAESISSGALSTELTQQGWRLLGFDDVPATEFSQTEEGIRVAGIGSNALIYRELDSDEAQSNRVRWQWRVDQLPSSKTLRKVDGDDRALALYVAFEIDQRNLSLWGRIRSSVVALFSGLPKGQILTYVWGKDDPTGEWFPNPYIRRIGRMQVLRNATTTLGTWQQEDIDLVADFTAAFGYAPIRPVYIALSADTEDSGEPSLSFIRQLELYQATQ